MNDSLLYIASYLQHIPSVNHYKLSSKFYNEDFLAAAQRLNIDQLEKLEKEGYILTDQYMYTYKDIKDMGNNQVGIHLMGMPKKEIFKAIESEKKSVWMMAGISGFLLLLVLVFMLILQREKCKTA